MAPSPRWSCSGAADRCGRAGPPHRLRLGGAASRMVRPAGGPRPAARQYRRGPVPRPGAGGRAGRPATRSARPQPPCLLRRHHGAGPARPLVRTARAARGRRAARHDRDHPTAPLAPDTRPGQDRRAARRWAPDHRVPRPAQDRHVAPCGRPAPSHRVPLWAARPVTRAAGRLGPVCSAGTAIYAGPGCRVGRWNPGVPVLASGLPVPGCAAATHPVPGQPPRPGIRLAGRNGPGGPRRRADIQPAPRNGRARRGLVQRRGWHPARCPRPHPRHGRAGQTARACGRGPRRPGPGTLPVPGPGDRGRASGHRCAAALPPGPAFRPGPARHREPVPGQLRCGRRRADRNGATGRGRVRPVQAERRPG